MDHGGVLIGSASRTLRCSEEIEQLCRDLFGLFLQYIVSAIVDFTTFDTYRKISHRLTQSVAACLLASQSKHRHLKLVLAESNILLGAFGSCAIVCEALTHASKPRVTLDLTVPLLP